MVLLQSSNLARGIARRFRVGGHCRTRCPEVPPTAHTVTETKSVFGKIISPFPAATAGSGVTDAGTAMRHGGKP